MKKLALGFGLTVLAFSTTPSEARCTCQCVNGQMQPLCESSIDLPPICPPTICPIQTPSIAPLPSLGIPPLGTTRCRQVQVFNQYSMRYEWREVCR